MTSTKHIELRYSDTDQMGVIYHANYITFFEQGRTTFLNDLGIDYLDIEKQGVLFVVRNIEIKYKRPSTLDESLIVETTIDELTDYKMTFKHVIKNDKNQIKVIGKSSVASVKKDSFKLCKLKEELPKIYQIITS
ncbi:MAG: acyl-CoA thioesterase [Candidatus Izimaplasma sp.]|nr:acyl-CoA thioesterase [Candidatus Izimaplasma bacterium]